MMNYEADLMFGSYLMHENNPLEGKVRHDWGQRERPKPTRVFNRDIHGCRLACGCHIMAKKKSKKEDVVVEENPLDEKKQEATANESDKPENKEEKSSPEETIAKLEKELKDQKDQNLRLYAEFENFRRRTAKERMELFSTANEELMTAWKRVVEDT